MLISLNDLSFRLSALQAEEGDKNLCNVFAEGLRKNGFVNSAKALAPKSVQELLTTSITVVDNQHHKPEGSELQKGCALLQQHEIVQAIASDPIADIVTCLLGTNARVSEVNLLRAGRETNSAETRARLLPYEGATRIVEALSVLGMETELLSVGAMFWIGHSPDLAIGITVIVPDSFHPTFGEGLGASFPIVVQPGDVTFFDSRRVTFEVEPPMTDVYAIHTTYSLRWVKRTQAFDSFEPSEKSTAREIQYFGEPDHPYDLYWPASN